jgi:hypothetical protein
VDPASLLQRLNADAFMQWVRANKVKVIVTDFGASTELRCQQCLRVFLAWLHRNAYTDASGSGFIGWTYWAAGHSWGNYFLDISQRGTGNGVVKGALSQFLTPPV